MSEDQLRPSIQRLLGIEGAMAAHAVKVGSLWMPPTAVADALRPYSKQLFAHTDFPEHPLVFPSSGTAICIEDRYFLFCTGHQLHQFRADQIAFRPRQATVSASAAHVFRPT